MPKPSIPALKELSPDQRADLLKALKARFEKNMSRHPGLEWAKIAAKLEADPGKLRTLDAMERTGGEPDVAGLDKRPANTYSATAANKPP